MFHNPESIDMNFKGMIYYDKYSLNGQMVGWIGICVVCGVMRDA